MALPGNHAASQRLVWLRETLESTGAIRADAAADRLGVSRMTVRRDLVELEALGQARRVRGGAVAVGVTQLAERHALYAREKARISAKLLPLVPVQGVVMFDASSTILRLATALEGARDLLVLTNGVETFTALMGKPGIKPVLTGGEDPMRNGSLVGPVAVRVTAAFQASHAFLSAAGVGSAGSSEPTLEDVAVKREMTRVAAEAIVAVDSSKLEHRGPIRCHDWDEIGKLVTDLDPDDARLDSYRELTKII